MNSETRLFCKIEEYKEKTRIYSERKAKFREYTVEGLVLQDTEASDPAITG